MNKSKLRKKIKKCDHVWKDGGCWDGRSLNKPLKKGEAFNIGGVIAVCNKCGQTKILSSKQWNLLKAIQKYTQKTL